MSYAQLPDYIREGITDSDMETALEVEAGIRMLANTIRQADYQALGGSAEALEKLFTIEEIIIPGLIAKVSLENRPAATLKEQEEAICQIYDMLSFLERQDKEDEDWNNVLVATEKIFSIDSQSNPEINIIVGQDLQTIYERLAITNQDHNELLAKSMVSEIDIDTIISEAEATEAYIHQV